jgi:hypothetical protein
MFYSRIFSQDHDKECERLFSHIRDLYVSAKKKYKFPGIIKFFVLYSKLCTVCIADVRQLKVWYRTHVHRQVVIRYWFANLLHIAEDKQTVLNCSIKPSNIFIAVVFGGGFQSSLFINLQRSQCCRYTVVDRWMLFRKYLYSSLKEVSIENIIISSEDRLTRTTYLCNIPKKKYIWSHQKLRIVKASHKVENKIPNKNLKPLCKTFQYTRVI